MVPVPNARQISWIKALVFVACLTPFARLLWNIYTNNLGANPTEFITRNTGEWTLIFLCITLAITPVRRMTPLVWLLRLRRMLGLFAFFYVCLHFMTFIWFDHFFDLSEMWRDIVKRPFITVGFIAFVLLVPLAATSNNRMIRLMGGRAWQSLHRVVYGIVLLGLLHFWWMKAGKNDFAEPLLYAAIIAALLGVRVFHAIAAKTASAAPERQKK